MSAPRIKDANFVQLHIEKLILAFGILVFVVGILLFVIGNPFAVELNRQTYADPGDAVDVLTRADTALENGLQDPKPLPDIEAPDFRENFLAMIEQRIDSDTPIASLANPGLTLPAVYPDIPNPSRYALVYPPTPKNINHVSGTDVLDKEFDLAATKRFFELWGKDIDEPGDFTMFIAAGDFDIYDWVTRLQADSQVEGDIKIPTGIWAQRFGIAGVALLREEWDPATGRWVDQKIVESLPNQDRILEDYEAPSETNAALAEIVQLREKQIELAQPELPYLTDFVQAVAPGDASEGVGVDDFLLGANGENLGPKEREILKLEEQIKQIEERRARQRGGRPGDRPGGDSAPAPRSDRPDSGQRQVDNIREKIERLRPQAAREQETRTRLAEENRRREEERRRREELRAARGGGDFGRGEDTLDQASIAGINLQEGSTLRVWAADPSMRPGKTYRYKLLVSVINPLYAVPRLAADQLAENKNRAALLPTAEEIENMPWIGPVKVEPKSRFFFTSGRSNSASIDIYRRFNGQLVYQDFDGSPGDIIGSVVEIEDEFGQTIEVDMSVGSVAVDIEQHRDPLSPGSTINSMIYMDAEGNIHERSESLDKNNPERKELSDEYRDGSERPLRPRVGEEAGDGGGADFDREDDF